MDDEQEGATWEYTYDQGGNILSKTKHVEGKSDETTEFSYTNPNWKDQLTAVNGVGITYDNIGNPESDGTWTYTWEKGRQLKRMQSVDTDASFVYNENGLRVQKTVNGVVTNYTLHGKNIVHLTQGNDTLHFFYDASGKPAIVEYNGTKYAYAQNLQGDIVAILDSAGNKVVEYAYDAWGRPIKKEGSLAETLGTVQPFRYRGYVYDEETGVYYLRSRYYCPIQARFINADMIILNDGFFASNLFCYCFNSPNNYADETGRGVNIELWGGRYYRIDPENPSTGEKRHIHIFEDGKEYSQNEDGSPHKGSKGEPNKSVKKYLKKNEKWDWDGNRAKYLNEIQNAIAESVSIEYVWTQYGDEFFDYERTNHKPYVRRVEIYGADGTCLENVDYESFIEAGGEPAPNTVNGTSLFYFPVVCFPVTAPTFTFSVPMIPIFGF